MAWCGALRACITSCSWRAAYICAFQGFRPGESVVVFGAGPVGLMAAYSATLRGASEVYVVDRVPERLQKAKEIGCVPVDCSKGDPVELIKALRGGQVFLLLYVSRRRSSQECDPQEGR